MPFDYGGLETPSRAESLTLMGSVPIGRVVFTERALPAVQPVNFVLDGADVVFRAVPGSRLAAATRGNIVAFEADDFDAASRSGWSVTIVGRARHVHDPEELAVVRRLPLDSWAPGPRDHDHYVLIEAGLVVGRRLPLGRPTVNSV
ncbi:MAG: pyridoxamine 5'-phosphate oxidase family protein [Streptosporangiales bacterium]|nr:pyridoxamine 5'-phosphate oxidase family protein [Streptosporangiales bacterium]